MEEYPPLPSCNNNPSSAVDNSHMMTTKQDVTVAVTSSCKSNTPSSQPTEAADTSSSTAPQQPSVSLCTESVNESETSASVLENVNSHFLGDTLIGDPPLH